MLCARGKVCHGDIGLFRPKKGYDDPLSHCESERSIGVWSPIPASRPGQRSPPPRIVPHRTSAGIIARNAQVEQKPLRMANEEFHATLIRASLIQTGFMRSCRRPHLSDLKPRFLHFRTPHFLEFYWGEVCFGERFRSYRVLPLVGLR